MTADSPKFRPSVCLAGLRRRRLISLPMVQSLQGDAHYLDVTAPPSDPVRQRHEDGALSRNRPAELRHQRHARNRATARRGAEQFDHLHHEDALVDRHLHALEARLIGG